MKLHIRIVIACLLIGSFSAVTPGNCRAEQVKLEVQSPNAVKLNLEKLVGKKVTLRVTVGEELSGTVQAVGVDAVTISQLSGREFFDAVVALDQIVAVIVRTHS